MKALVAAAILLALAVPARAQDADARGNYANDLRRTFLANGVSMDVFAPERRTANDSTSDPLKRYPRLIFFGYVNNSSVYQILVGAKVMEKARALGFKGIEFYSKGGLERGGWWYDISGAAPPPCDINKRLCL